jgi:hypothetical protein
MTGKKLPSEDEGIIRNCMSKANISEKLMISLSKETASFPMTG